MVNTIDMQDLRHLNLFVKVTRVPTRFCFDYNNAVIFCVPGNKVSQAIGKNAENIRRIGSIIKRRVKVIQKPEGVGDAKWFIEKIVSPVEFKDLEVNEKEVILTAGPQSKAALLGRNKRRLLEMQKIVKDFFGKEFRIV
jgi:transcription antitermination factor NusA-like protein